MDIKVNKSQLFYLKRNNLYEKQIVSFKNIVLSPGQKHMFVEIKMTKMGPVWVQHGLKFLYPNHIDTVWALAKILPI